MKITEGWEIEASINADGGYISISGEPGTFIYALDNDSPGFEILRKFGAALAAAPTPPAQEESFQDRVRPWMMECFGPEISSDKIERNHRFLEESLELVQACGCSEEEAHHLIGYVYNRPSGDRQQEVGGVMVTLAALCLANDLNMHQAGEVELARIWTKMEQIRAKQAAKPKHSPLPATPPAQEESPYIKIFANAKGSPAGYDTNIEHDDVFERLVTYFHAEVTLGRDDWIGDRHQSQDSITYEGPVPLYTRPDNNKLRKAAEELLMCVEGNIGVPIDRVRNLRAALEGK